MDVDNSYNKWLTWGIACTFPFPEFYNLYIGERKWHSHCGECTQKGERKIRLFRKPTKESENAIFHHNRRCLLHVFENKTKKIRLLLKLSEKKKKRKTYPGQKEKGLSNKTAGKAHFAVPLSKFNSNLAFSGFRIQLNRNTFLSLKSFQNQT